MREAARMEAATDKSPMTPGEVLPAQELYGDMLLLEEKLEPAKDAYLAVLARSPNRYRALLGAARAAELMSDEQEATTFFEQLLALTDGATGARPGIEHARELVSATPE
jgi:hypothetical protein